MQRTSSDNSLDKKPAARPTAPPQPRIRSRDVQPDEQSKPPLKKRKVILEETPLQVSASRQGVGKDLNRLSQSYKEREEVANIIAGLDEQRVQAPTSQQEVIDLTHDTRPPAIINRQAQTHNQEVIDLTHASIPPAIINRQAQTHNQEVPPGGYIGYDDLLERATNDHENKFIVITTSGKFHPTPALINFKNFIKKNINSTSYQLLKNFQDTHPNAQFFVAKNVKNSREGYKRIDLSNNQDIRKMHAIISSIKNSGKIKTYLFY